MSCTNEQLQLCNELHKPENGKAIATLTVVYGPYMNWGRWNTNTGRIMKMVNMLLEKNYAVQLKNDGVEKTWEDHGDVAIFYNDVQLAFAEKVQHNKNYSKRIVMMEELVAMAVDKYEDLAASKETKK